MFNLIRRNLGLVGVVGLALSLFGLATLLFTMSWLSWVHLAAGGLLLVVWLFGQAGRLGELLRGRALRAFTETGLTAVFLLVALVALNLIVNLSPRQFDWTSDRIHSLSEQTERILAGLDTEVEALLFQQGGALPPAEDLLKLYNYAQPKFRWRVIDPERRPELAERHEIRQNGTLLLLAGGRQQRITEIDEQSVTNGLLELLAGQAVVVGFLEDHGERAIFDDSPGGLTLFRVWLEEANYEVRSLSLIETGRVPADVDILVVAGPQADLLPAEAEAVHAWLARGGALIALADPHRRGAAGLVEPLGAGFGLDVIIDEMQQLFTGPTLGTQFLVSRYGSHPLVQDFRGRTLWLDACSLDLAAAPTTVTWSPVVESSRVSWAERDLERLYEAQEAELDAADLPGPVLVGAIFEGHPEASTAAADGRHPRGFVACDSDFLSNRMLGQLANRDFALNLVAWLGGQTEQISVRPKQRGMTRIQMTRSEMLGVFYATVLIGPELLLLAGLTVWWRRRRTP